MAGELCETNNYTFSYRDPQTATSCGNVCNIVWGQWQHSGELANDWFGVAKNYLCAIASQEPVNANVNVDITEVSPTSVVFDVGDVPAVDPDKFALVELTPISNVVLGPVRDTEVGDAPVNTAQKPGLDYGVLPNPLTATAPTNVPDINYGNAPAEDTYVFPSEPNLVNITFPDVPVLPDVPEFAETIPTEDIQLPITPFDWSEDAYTSALMVDINSALIDAMSGDNTGISAQAEQIMYSRAADRSNNEVQAARNAAIDAFAARGFVLPQGTLHGTLVQLEKERLDKLGEVNREVYLDQAKRAYEFYKLALQVSVQWETELMAIDNQRKARLFEAAQFMQNILFKRFESQVALYNAQIAGYTAVAQVYRVRVEANLQYLEQYKAELEGAKIKGDLRAQDVALYTARLQAVNTQIEVYKSKVEAYVARIRAEGLKVDTYKTEVDAFTALVDAKASEYRAYGTRVQAELGKIQGYAAEVDAYKSEVGAFTALVDASKMQTQSDIDKNQQLIEQFKAQVTGFEAQLRAESVRIDAEAKAFSSQIQGFAAAVESKSTEVKSEQTRYQIEATNSFNQAQLRLREATANVENAQKSLTLLLELNRSGADIAAGVGSAAFAAVSTQASLSGYSTITGGSTPVFG